MRVKVRLERERGMYQAAYAAKSAAGDLHLTYRTSANRRVSVLQLLGAERQFPSLYDPKLIELSGSTLRFVGYEQVESAWVLQEWICDVVA